MLNKLDDAVAPHLCQYSLFITCIILFTFFILFDDYVNYVFFLSFIANLYFAIKVLQVRHDRNRIYKIIKSRILKKGYSKDIFKGKCDSICQLAQAIYISIRFKSIKDIFFFFNDRKSKTPHFIIEDENLENILNNIDIKSIKEGQVIFQGSSKR